MSAGVDRIDAGDPRMSAGSEVTIGARFAGPPGAANGGYVSGLLAGHMAPGSLRVTLRRPVPVDVPLTVTPVDADGPAPAGADAGGLVLTDAGGAVLVLAEPSGPPETGEPPEVGIDQARAARPDPAMLDAHPFPSCFGCGPRRDPADAVALHVGPLADGVWATAWTPGAGLPHDADGVLAPEIVWTALDCPSSFAAVPAGSPPNVLGRIEGETLAPVHVGEEVVVLAWPLGHEGRKRWGATAIRGAGGDLRARARATWIALA